MSEKKYLDYEGLQDVAGKVNTRLKTVTEMPATASNGAVRLYVGESTGNYIKGHIYQNVVTQFFAWKSPDSELYVYTLSEQPVAGDLAYGGPSTTLHPSEEVISYDSALEAIELSDAYWERNTLHDTVTSTWTDITPSGGGGSSSASDVSYDNTTSGLTASNVQEAIDELTENVVSLDEFATTFSTSVRYCYGDIVYKDNKLYICTTDYTQGSWAAYHWAEISKIFDSLNYRLLQCKNMPYWNNYDSSRNGTIIQYVGPTSINYKNGHFYKYDSSFNRWNEFQLQEMDSTLSETSTNGIQNQAVTRGISDAESNANAYTRAMIAESITNVLSQEF